MEQIKLFDAELRLMEIVWQHEPVSAKEISLIAAREIGWNKNTTYTVLKKLVEKAAVQRSEPNFLCTARITREQVGTAETKRLIDKLYDGSAKAFLASFLQKEKLSAEELAELKNIINKGFDGKE
jgi:BlaI family transcriptional regulator, penicillinase repressor